MATYKDYNNYSQQDKDSMRTRANDISNENEATLIGQTDEVEALLRTIIQKLDALNLNTDTIESKLDGIDEHIDGVENTLSTMEGDLTTLDASVKDTTHEVTSQGQAIVQAIQGH